MPGSESSWIVSLQSLETTQDMSGLDGLLMLKSKVPFTKSTHSLRNLGQLFLRKTSTLIEERVIFSDEKLALQMLNIVKDFWSLLSSQHVMLTQQAYGRYSALLYEVLPSLASVYIDLFIAVHSTKSTVGKAAKRLYSWLMFELNERSIKTALLEVCGCTASGARLVLPVLRTVLSSPSASTSNLDYLLHFILLKRWSFICADLCDLIQVSASIQAPGGFLEWLVQRWPKAAIYLLNDKSFKGRRISEFLLELDQQAVEELIDVFSEALSVEQTSEQITDEVSKKTAEKAVTEKPFFIDKIGSGKDEMQPKAGQQCLQYNQRESGRKKNVQFPKNHDRRNKRDSDILMFSGLTGDSSCGQAYEEEVGGNNDSFMDFSVEESAVEETEFQRTETMQLSKKKKRGLSYPEDRLSAECNIGETQVVAVEDTGSKDVGLSIKVAASKGGHSKEGDEPESMDHETDYTWESTGSNDIMATVPESQVKPDITTGKTRSISVHKSAQAKNSQTDKENEGSSNVTASASESMTSLKKYQENPKTHRNDADSSSGVDDTPTVNLDTQPGPQLTSGLHKVLRSNISPHSSFADQIVKNKRNVGPKINRIRTRTFTETDSNEKWCKDISCATQPFESAKLEIGTVTTTDGCNTEYNVGLMLSTIRKSMSDRKRKPEGTADTFHVKTRLRTKSAQSDHVHETRSRNPSVTAAEDGLTNWLRQSANSVLKNHASPKHLMRVNKEVTKSPIKNATVKNTTATEIKGLREIFGTPLKTYSRKDRKKCITVTPELPMVRDKSPKKKTATHSTEVNSTPELTLTAHQPPKKSSEEPEQRRYFLRTNCSHRLLTEDTVCPSCSPTTKV